MYSSNLYALATRFTRHPANGIESLYIENLDYDETQYKNSKAVPRHNRYKITALKQAICSITLVSAMPAMSAVPSAAIMNADRHGNMANAVNASTLMLETSDATRFSEAPTQLAQQQQAWQDAIIQQRIESLQSSQPAPLSSASINSNAPSTHNDIEPNVADAQTQQPITEEDRTTKQASNCLEVTKIRLQGLTGLDNKHRQTLKNQADKLAADNCVSLMEANRLARSITEAYLQAGYFKVNIHPQILVNAESNWQVSPAKIVAIDNQTKLPTPRLFGNIVGQPANIAWLDQAVSNGERLIDGRLLLDVYPVGDDVRLVVSQRGHIETVDGDIEWYRDPDSSFGHHQLTGRVALNNVLGQADVISVSLQQSLADNYGYDRGNQRRSASLYANIPNGRWQWSTLLAGSEYDRSTALANSILKQSGNSWQANIRGDYVWSRDQTSITTAYGQLAHQEVSSKILGSKLDTQSPTLSSARVGISRTQLFRSADADKASNNALGMSGAWVVDLSAEKGLSLHDNPATKAGLSDDYWRFLLSGYLTHQHALTSGNSVQLTHELQGQYSQDQLFGISQMSLDGRYAGVRGLTHAPISASSGVTLRNTLAFEPNRLKWASLGQQSLRWSPYIGWDYGRMNTATSATEGAKESADNEYAYSGTLGLKLTGYDQKMTSLNKRWEFDISASQAKAHYAAMRQVDKRQDTEVAAALRLFF